MKAILTLKLDTSWTNQVIATVEAELDNADELTKKHLSTQMVRAIQLLGDEVRAESERAIYTARERDLETRERNMAEREGEMERRENAADVHERAVQG